jgi:LytS/YehU family sensor histidine kinase
VASYAATARLAAAQAATEGARRAAAETRLKLLEAQLEPHMLFNTLANLRALIGSDPPRAQAMLDRLIAFLRATLDASRADARAHTLADEFARLADYLALMQVRMGARLQVRLDLPAPLRTQALPPLLLQPLVENAIRHGVEPKLDGGRIEVQARRDGDRLVLVVRDTGVGLDAPAQSGSRFGLQQVRERLAALYGERASLALQPAGDADGGAAARIELPVDA